MGVGAAGACMYIRGWIRLVVRSVLLYSLSCATPKADHRRPVFRDWGMVRCPSREGTYSTVQVPSCFLRIAGAFVRLFARLVQSHPVQYNLSIIHQAHGLNGGLRSEGIIVTSHDVLAIDVGL